MCPLHPPFTAHILLGGCMMCLAGRRWGSVTSSLTGERKRVGYARVDKTALRSYTIVLKSMPVIISVVNSKYCWPGTNDERP